MFNVDRKGDIEIDSNFNVDVTFLNQHNLQLTNCKVFAMGKKNEKAHARAINNFGSGSDAHYTTP